MPSSVSTGLSGRLRSLARNALATSKSAAAVEEAEAALGHGLVQWQPCRPGHMTTGRQRAGRAETPSQARTKTRHARQLVDLAEEFPRRLSHRKSRKQKRPIKVGQGALVLLGCGCTYNGIAAFARDFRAARPRELPVPAAAGS
ncbi:hypothetical protein [Jiella pelagia]|uniref:Uncharacterized protein n=1 Tax=Jiella pelagia TaxID=2986949 RepID=A0ABY7C1L8_9HYPH|nr:hypothetical protein [Jiella pelagia]WAP68929.1 hypothetical protein OH818_27615 [Jiella pelagia]